MGSLSSLTSLDLPRSPPALCIWPPFESMNLRSFCAASSASCTWVANQSFEMSKFKFKISESSNLRTSQGSFSAVSKPKFASKYSLESSRRDLHNALLCTVLMHRFGIHNRKRGKKEPGRSLILIFSLKIADMFADFLKQNFAKFVSEFF